jgi:hypothetical protein
MASEAVPPVVLPSGRFSGRDGFAQLVRDGLACAALQGWREIIVCDASFEDWPLHERLVVESLRAWSKTGRRFIMLAHRYDAVLRQHARFVAWRKAWGHIIDCRVCRNLDPVDFPSAMWSPVWAMRRLDLVHSAGVSGSEPERRVQMRELLDEMILSSSPGFPASTLGL